MKVLFQWLLAAVYFLGVPALAANPVPLLKCTITKSILLGIPATFNVTVYNSFLAGINSPSTDFTVARAVISPDRSSCEIQINYEESHMTLSVPMSFDARHITGTHNDDPIDVSCFDFRNKKSNILYFVENYKNDFSYCLMK